MAMTREFYKDLVAPSVKNDILSPWRERIFFAIFLSVIVMALAPYIFSAIRVIDEKRWGNLFLYTLGYLCIITIVWVPRIPFRIRVIIGLGTFYLLGLTALLSIGLLGSGRLWLFSFSIIASLLIGLRAGLITMLINAGTLFILGFLLAKGQLEWASGMLQPMKIWTVTSITFLSLNTVITVSLSLLVRALERQLLQEQQMTMKLATTNEQLEQDQEKRRHAEKTLRESEAKLQAIFDTVGTGILIIDKDTQIIIEANPIAIEMTGLRKEGVIGQICHLLVCPAQVGKCPVKDLGQNIDHSERKLICADGYIKDIIKTVCPITVEGRACYIESFIDISKQKQAEEEKQSLESRLNQAQKMESIGTLAGGIAHDFNNILSPIVGYTEMLLEDVPEDSPFKDSLNPIYTSALRAQSLVKQILTFSRQGSGELMLMKMQPVVKEALKLIRSTIPTTIEIIQDINPDCGVIKADPTQIHQIVMNLATNAYHAMEETGGELKVSLKQVELGEYDIITPNMTPGVYACLTIADTGVGMDKNLTDKIFDPFFTTKALGKGTGMGLSVVHGIVTAMGGTIHVYSEPGKGTEFHVYLPVEKSFSETQATQATIPIRGGTEHILFVDDEEVILQMETLMLERLGYQVTSRTSSLEALEAFRQNPDRFDMVITDMAMPNMPGNKLSIELTKIRPDIPVLLCTGFSETMSEEKATSMGIKGFLLKPIIMKDLAQKMREVLDKK